MIAADTRQLASARFEVVSDARARSFMRAALVAVLLVVALIAGLRLLADRAAVANERARLQQENTGLRAEVARLEAELELERATHAGLDAQVGDLNRQVAALKRQLAFVTAQEKRP
jgi:septal ring factor EnvC (AmiA/AmiB activator)